MRVLLFVGFLLVLHGVAISEMSRWVDDKGRVHYSNRSQNDATETTPPPATQGEGWESIIERQHGQDDFAMRADRIINSLGLDRRKKRRELKRTHKSLKKTQGQIVQAQRHNRTDITKLTSIERQLTLELQKINLDLASIDGRLTKARAIKDMGRERARTLGEDPFFQFGQ